MSTNQKPSVGRVVHYILPNGEARPAMIVRRWEDNPDDRCNLQVFTDGGNDVHQDPAAGNGIMWKTSIARSDAPEPGKWMWPPYVAPKPEAEARATP